MTTSAGGELFTLIDLASRLEQGSPARSVIELLNKRNPILEDIPWMEANDGSVHVVTQRTGLPTVYYRSINSGVPNSKSTTAQIREGTAILEARTQLDVKLAEMSKSPERLRQTEAAAAMESMKQTTVETLLYGNASISPKQFTGFFPRYSLLSAGNGENIIDAGGANSVNTSMLLAVWGETTGHGIYPAGTTGGLKHEDLGIGDAFDSDGNRFRAFLDRYEWCQGLAIKDWQFFVRIANIDKTKLVTESGAADLTKKMTLAISRIPDLSAGTPVWYMNRTVFQMLTIQRQAVITSGGGITWENIDGKMVYKFMGIPIRISDSILLNETRVV